MRHWQLLWCLKIIISQVFIIYMFTQIYQYCIFFQHSATYFTFLLRGRLLRSSPQNVNIYLLQIIR